MNMYISYTRSAAAAARPTGRQGEFDVIIPQGSPFTKQALGPGVRVDALHDAGHSRGPDVDAVTVRIRDLAHRHADAAGHDGSRTFVVDEVM